MNICIPINEDKGLESTVCAHFGAAPFFMIVDTDSGAHKTITNQNLHHGHGMCKPLAALGGESLGGVVVGGIGMGAFQKLRAANIQVYLSEYATVEETIAAFKEGKLSQMTAEAACGQHGSGQHGSGQHGSGQHGFGPHGSGQHGRGL